MGLHILGWVVAAALYNYPPEGVTAVYFHPAHKILTIEDRFAPRNQMFMINLDTIWRTPV